MIKILNRFGVMRINATRKMGRAAFAGVVVAMALGTAELGAVPITGEIHFAGGFTPIDVGGIEVSLGSATGLEFHNPAAVMVASGDFASYVSAWTTPAVFVDSFNFNPLNPSPVDSLWNSGGFSFTMNAVQVVHQDNLQLNLLGTGYISGNGFTPTYGSWNFQGGGSGMFTFRANDTASGVAVPDGGNTFLLLGSAFLGLGLLASQVGRKKSALN